jgi:hypothetical protein
LQRNRKRSGRTEEWKDGVLEDWKDASVIFGVLLRGLVNPQFEIVMEECGVEPWSNGVME